MSGMCRSRPDRPYQMAGSHSPKFSPSGPGVPTERMPKEIKKQNKTKKLPSSSGLRSQRALDIRKLSTFLHHKLSPIILTSCPPKYEFPYPVFWMWIQGGLQTEGHRGQERASISWGNCLGPRVVRDGELNQRAQNRKKSKSKGILVPDPRSISQLH